jgi:hypothetical protein
MVDSARWVSYDEQVYEDETKNRKDAYKKWSFADDLRVMMVAFTKTLSKILIGLPGERIGPDFCFQPFSNISHITRVSHRGYRYNSWGHGDAGAVSNA